MNVITPAYRTRPSMYPRSSTAPPTSSTFSTTIPLVPKGSDVESLRSKEDELVERSQGDDTESERWCEEGEGTDRTEEGDRGESVSAVEEFEEETLIDLLAHGFSLEVDHEEENTRRLIDPISAIPFQRISHDYSPFASTSARTKSDYQGLETVEGQDFSSRWSPEALTEILKLEGIGGGGGNREKAKMSDLFANSSRRRTSYDLPEDEIAWNSRSRRPHEGEKVLKFESERDQFEEVHFSVEEENDSRSSRWDFDQIFSRSKDNVDRRKNVEVVVEGGTNRAMDRLSAIEKHFL